FSKDGDDADSPWGDNDTTDEPSDPTPDLAAAVSDRCSGEPVTELYDLGSTWHISPYHDNFESFATILLKPFLAANKQRFNAIGIGEMVIDVPNSFDVSQLRLTEVLFSPEVGYTLVSIGHLDELGYSVTF
ncbi:hypothetical protein PAXRUDRAFT_94975, partial [Paxillus rubicundulus Ve08.2h10]